MIPFMVARLACLSIPADPGRFRQRPPIPSRHAQSEARTKPVSRWLVVGCDGLLGQDLVLALGEKPEAHEVTAVDRDVLDIRDPDACLAAVADHDLVVNVAAWTAVDDAESHESAAFAVNAVGAANLARACSGARIPMVQLSTDYG